MKSKSWLSINYFLQFLVTGVFLPFWILYLTSVKNLSILEASSVFSMVYLARFLSGFVLSPLLIRKYSMSISVKIVSLLGAMFSIFYIFTDDKILLMIITFLFGITFFTLSPLTEGMASIFLKEENVDYGHVRLFGSLGYMFIGIILGSVIKYTGNITIEYTLVLFTIAYCIFFFFKQPSSVSKIKIEKELELDSSTKPYVWILKDKNALLVVFVIFILQLSHTAYNNYNVLYLDSLNISYKWLTGIILNISVVCEIIFFIFSNKLVSKVSPTKLLIFAALVAAIRWFALGVTHNIYIFTLMQTLHAITYGFVQIAFILILNKYFTNNKILDMQNLYASVCTQLSNFLGLYIIGFLWEDNSNLVFVLSGVVAFIAMLIATQIKWNKKGGS